MSANELKKLEGNLVNVFTGEIYGAEILFDKTIISVKQTGKIYNSYIAPGFIDAHIHIESSMLCPSRFAEAVAPHGTVATISDPHEIANVFGTEGVKYMIEDAKQTPVKIRYTAPSCVPATEFETAGATIDANEIEELLKLPEIVALGEFMNFPGVIFRNPECMAKIEAAKKAGKPIDGHAPLVTGEDLQKYVSAGITTEHESSSAAEAEEKNRLGMKILIREGSSAKNLKALAKVKKPFALVSDDKHPDELLTGHLNSTLAMAVSLGIEPVRAIQMVTINPSSHYGIGNGAIAPGWPADIVVLEDLKNFKVLQTYIDGQLIAENGKALFSVNPIKCGSGVNFKMIEKERIAVKHPKKIEGSSLIRTVKIIPDQIITDEGRSELKVVDGEILQDMQQDVIKLVVAERYGHGNVGVCFVQGFGIKDGAIASTVAHDSHNIICAGTDDKFILSAIEAVSRNGGMCYAGKNGMKIVELPIAGLMSDKTAEEVARQTDELNEIVKKSGCSLHAPFMTLSFLALLVIPKMKLSDKGLFDGSQFKFVDVVIE